MHRIHTIEVVAILAILPSAASAYEFTPVVSSGARIPGSTSDFGRLSGPATDGHGVAFWGIIGLLNSSQGVYVMDNGVIRKVADYNMLVPGTNYKFMTFGAISLVQGKTAFTSNFRDGFTSGIYIDSGGITKVVDTLTRIPGRTDNFNWLLKGSFDGNRLAFHGTSASGYDGIFTNESGLVKIVDSETPVPGGQGGFTGFSRPRFQGKDIVFLGEWGGKWAGVYSTRSGLHAIADIGTTIPGRSDQFTTFVNAWASENRVVFLGYGTSSRGLYMKKDGLLERIADTEILAPDTGTPFTSFDTGSVVLDDNRVIFKASSAGVTGIYLYDSSGISKIINSLDVLDGSTRTLEFTTDGLSDTTFVFDAAVGNDHTIYRTTIPEPNTLLLIAGVGLVTLVRRTFLG